MKKKIKSSFINPVAKNLRVNRHIIIPMKTIYNRKKLKRHEQCDSSRC